MNAVFEYKEELAPGVSTFWFRPNKSFTYIAGQFIEMYLPHAADKRGDKRWFTLSSNPSQELISITTKFAEQSSSFKTQLAILQPGNAVRISNSMGDFVLPKKINKPLLFVAGGIGITPFHSMISWLTAKKELRNITVVYAANYEQDLVFLNELKSEATVIPIVKKGSAVWTGETGTLSSDRIITVAPLVSGTKLYLSGPEKMVEAITHDLLDKHGLRKQNVITDYFPGYEAI